MAVALAVLGALVLVAGLALVWVPGAVMVAGVELMAAGYVKRYVDVQQEEASE